MKTLALVAALSIAGCTAHATSPIEKVKPNEFMIDCPNGSGSGVRLQTGDILTAAHVIEDGKGCIAVTESGKKYPLVLRRMDPTVDLALMGFSGGFTGEVPKTSGIPLAVTNPPQYSFVFTMGHPLAFQTQIVTKGEYQGSAGDGHAPYLDVITAPITFGNSGGPVFVLENGKPVILGIVDALPSSMGQYPTFHLGLIVNLKTIKEFLQ